MTTPRCLVFSGGGLRGLAYVGALRALADTGRLRLETVTHTAGTSVGALTAALLALGYTLDELERLVLEEDFSKYWAWGTLPSDARWGWTTGKALVDRVEELVRSKSGVTGLFVRDVPTVAGKHVTVVVTDVATCKPVYISSSCSSHSSHGSCRLSDVVVASMRIPLLFTPLSYSSSSCWVDGGCTDNFPLVHVMRSEGLEGDPESVWGFRVEMPESDLSDMDNLSSYIERVSACLLSPGERLLDYQLSSPACSGLSDRIITLSVDQSVIGSPSRAEREDLVHRAYMATRARFQPSSASVGPDAGPDAETPLFRTVTEAVQTLDRPWESEAFVSATRALGAFFLLHGVVVQRNQSNAQTSSSEERLPQDESPSAQHTLGLE